ncbi:hypothetical protein ACIQXW_23530 [Lysinibacillus sp. NPDC097162]|uniref:hypothetical protein n=1 Tax=Lysinibacillus sp. NPDC097162 TaxID=3364140 RepID=UPI0037FD69D9
MAKYESRYKSLGFYVNGELKRFNNGIYATEDVDEMAVLDAIADVTRIDLDEKPEAKPAPKAPAKRSASAK